MRSRLLPLPVDPRWRRLFGLVVFLGAVVALRHLALLFVCFVLLSRGLGAASGFFERKLRIERQAVLMSILGIFGAMVGVLVLTVARRLAPFVARAQVEWRDWFGALTQNPAFVKLRDLTGISDEDLAEKFRTHALDAVRYVDATAHGLLYIVIAIIVAVMYLLEHKELRTWRAERPPQGIADVLLRWFGYVADAIVVTARMQVVVAVVNAVVTLPILLLLRLPHVGMLTLLILLSGLVPVVGNLVSGAVLCIVAFESKGAWAVGIFILSTFVLHKIESYYLNPRLAAEHVHLPALLLVASLILFEHSLGLAGLFLSFPALYVGSRILHEWQGEVEAEDAAKAARPEGGAAVGV
jgi:predicted PurR-regulated permease PerM